MIAKKHINMAHLNLNKPLDIPPPKLVEKESI
jgi:hypothetical protein